MATSRYFSLKNLPEISLDIEERYARAQKLYKSLLEGTPKAFVLCLVTFHCLKNLHEYEIQTFVPMFERGLSSLLERVRITRTQAQEIHRLLKILLEYQNLSTHLIPLLACAEEETTEKLLQKTSYDTELDSLKWAEPLPPAIQEALATRLSNMQVLS